MVASTIPKTRKPIFIEELITLTDQLQLSVCQKIFLMHTMLML